MKMNASKSGIPDLNVTPKDATHVRLVLEFPWEVLNKKIDEEARELKRALILPGYRPGRAPIPLIRARFWKAIEEKILEWVREQFFEKLRETDLDLLDTPIIIPKPLEENKPYVIDTVAMVWPEIDILEEFKWPSKNELQKAVEQAEKEQLERIKQNEIEKQAVLKPVEDREVEPADVVRLKIRLKEEDEEEWYEDKEGIVIFMANELYHPSLKRHLLGKKPGEKVEWELDVPQLGDAPIRGETDDPPLTYSRFNIEVTIEGVFEVELPDLETFLEDEGYDDEAEWEETLKVKHINELEDAKIEALKKLLITPMYSVSQLPEVPIFFIKPFLERELDEYVHKHVKAYENSTKVLIHIDRIFKEKFDEAKHALCRALVVRQLIRQKQIQPSEEVVDAFLEEFAKRTGSVVPAFKAEVRKNPDALNRFMNELAERILLSGMLEEKGIQLDFAFIPEGVQKEEAEGEQSDEESETHKEHDESTSENNSA